MLSSEFLVYFAVLLVEYPKPRGDVFGKFRGNCEQFGSKYLKSESVFLFGVCCLPSARSEPMPLLCLSAYHSNSPKNNRNEVKTTNIDKLGGCQTKVVIE